MLDTIDGTARKVATHWWELVGGGLEDVSNRPRSWASALTILDR